MLGLVVYFVFVATGAAVLWMCRGAFRRDDGLQTILRLVGLVLYVAGCTVAASGRIFYTLSDLPAAVLIGVMIADVGALVLITGLSKRIAHATDRNR